ncbi:MAG: ABC transporter substrate-binding protein, partial [Jatrophihabitantaceae bacterium]
MSDLTRRGFLVGLGAAGTAAALGGCATATSKKAAKQTGGTVTLQSDLSSPEAKSAMEKLIAAFNARGGAKASLNTVAAETFRTQLPSYLTSGNPPDVYTEGAGSVARAYADKGLLLDVSDVWTSMSNYSPALKALSTDTKGSQIFVPTAYYWWGMFYRKSNFAKWGVQPARTWDEFVALCKTLQSKGVKPIGIGAGGTPGTPWVASSWFDYLDVRLNGAAFHRDLLAGKQSFTDAKVKNVFSHWKTVLAYFDPKGTARSFQDATTALIQGETGMMLIGTFFADAAPKNVLADIDFFQFPSIDPSVPMVEEAPTDGFFASSHSAHVKGTKELLTYLATAPAQELYTS